MHSGMNSWAGAVVGSDGQTYKHSGRSNHTADESTMKEIAIAVIQVTKRFLEDFGVKFQLSPLQKEFVDAINTGNKEKVIEMISSKKIHVDANIGGETPLMMAARSGHSEMAKVLLDLGADFRFKNREGETAAGIASQSGHNEVVVEISDAVMQRHMANTSGPSQG